MRYEKSKYFSCKSCSLSLSGRTERFISFIATCFLNPFTVANETILNRAK